MSQNNTNIIGISLKDYVKEQIRVRADKGSRIQRADDQVQYLANKNCWIKLSSFVDVVETDVKTANGGDFLARNWVLFGGTSYYDNQKFNLRSGVTENYLGIDRNSTTEAYGLGGTDQLGYRPMPGIISANIEHAGRAGSLRQADIKIKVWTRDQLDVIEKLYFRLGYSCLLEWGHSVYFDNNGNIINSPTSLDIFNPKNKNLFGSKDSIIEQINKKREESYGNYDGLYGLIYNYDWSLSSDGGYDCSIKLVGLGSIIDSLKLNQQYTMPAGEDDSLNKESTYDGVFPQAIVASTPEISAEDRKINKSFTGIDFPDFFNQSIENADPLLLDWELFKQFGNEQAEITIQYLPKKDINLNNSARLKISVSDLGNILNNLKDPSLKYLFNFDLNETNKSLKLYKKVEVINGLEVIYNPETKTISPVDNTESLKQTFKELGAAILDYVSNTVAFSSAVQSNAITVSLNIVDIQIVFRNANNALKLVNPNLINPTTADIGFDKNSVNYLLSRFSFEYKKIVNNTILNTLLESPKPEIRQSVVNKNRIKVSLKAIPKVASDNKGTSKQQKADNYKIASQTLKNLAVELLNTKKEIYKGAVTINGENLPNVSINDFTKAENQPYDYLIFYVDFNYDENKLSTSSNEIPDIPGYALDEDQTILNKSLTSNLTKFLIKINDSINNENELVGSPQDREALISDLLNSGALEPLRLKNIPNNNNDESNLIRNIKKGFNAGILSGQTKDPNLVPDVDYTKLFQVFYPGIYLSGQPETKYCYIRLGLLLYYINNSSLLYEYKNDSKVKKPVVYIDYNPNTNFCLTTNYHFSVDPEVCLIPLNFSEKDYVELFPNNVLADQKIINSKSNDSLPDIISSEIPSGFVNPNESKLQRGRIMDILVNTDHIINLISSQAQSNPKSDVYLRPFLETLMESINKALGNINVFRVGYDDDANALRIYDEQLVYHEDLVTRTKEKQNSIIPTGIPVTGKNSIVRSIELKSDVSSRIGKRIFISAQAGNYGDLNDDASSLGSLNSDGNMNLIDRVMQIKGVAVDPKNKVKEQINEGDIVSAKKFNSYVYNLYSQKTFYKEDLELAKNYYSTAANKSKAENPSTKSRTIIPMSLNVTMDGITGLTLLEGFTLPTNVLPKQYLDNNNNSKVGFAVAGLNHTISDNQWITNIRGLMIVLPESLEILLGEFGEASTAKGAPNVNFDYGPAVPVGDNNLLKNQEFLNKVGRICKKYGFNPLDMLKVFHAESGISTTAQNRQEGRLVAAGLMQWTNKSGVLNYSSSKKYRVNSLQDILKLDSLQQLDLVDEYFKGSPISKLSASEKSSFFGLYQLVFLPGVLPGKPDSQIAQSKDLSARTISIQNPAVAKLAGKVPGDSLTKGDFRKYCAVKFNIKLPPNLKFE